jgi:hypothetical protein
MMIRKRFQPFLRQQRCLASASSPQANGMSLNTSIRGLARNRAAIPSSIVRLKSQSSLLLSARNYYSSTVLQAASANKHGEDEYLRSVYCDKTARAGLREDPIQLHTLKSLDRLRRELKQVKPPTQIAKMEASPTKPQSTSNNSSSWSSWFGGASTNDDATKNRNNATKKEAPMPKLPKGCYLHGGE